MAQTILAALERFWSAVKPFWLRVSGKRALLEGFLLAFALLFLVSGIAGEFNNNFALANFILFTSTAAGFWMALRQRREPHLGFRGVLMREALFGIFLGVLVGPGLSFLYLLMGRTQIFEDSTYGITFSIFILTCSGLAYYAMRAAVWVMSFWNQLRSRSLMWSLTHAHLMVVVIAALIGVILLTIYALTFNNGQDIYAQLPPMPRFISRILTTLLPYVGIFSVLTIIAMVVVLPPSALFSFLFARQTTRRLQKIVQTAQRFRSGDYQARVEVEGQDEVAQLQSDFNGMAETLESTLKDLQNEQQRVSGLLQSRRQLVAGVSHELRTPVATLRSYLETALESWKPEGDPALRDDLEIMRRETVRLQTMIDDLFTLSRAEVSGLSLSPQPVDLNALVRQRVAAVAPLAWNASRIEVIADVPKHLPPALADPTRLDQVLVNLLRNALRYTPPGGIIAVTAAVDSGGLRLDVRDTGSGISEADLPRIWDRFYRGAGTAEAAGGKDAGGKDASHGIDAGGAGLGLALVKELTEAMDGKVEVESRLGEGSCFTIRLQCASCDNSATA